MTSSRLRKSLALLVVSGFLLTACGGGGSETAQSNVQGPVSVLGWTPPANYADNAAVDPLRDLDHYELYVRQDNNFIDNDLPVALIAAVTVQGAIAIVSIWAMGHFKVVAVPMIGDVQLGRSGS